MDIWISNKSGECGFGLLRYIQHYILKL